MIWRRFKQTDDRGAAERLHTILPLDSGQSAEAINDILHVHPKMLKRWLKAFASGSEDALIRFNYVSGDGWLTDEQQHKYANGRSLLRRRLFRDVKVIRKRLEKPMTTHDVQEYHLDIASATSTTLHTLYELGLAKDIHLTTLAVEYRNDAHCLEKLYSLAKTVHAHPTWSLAAYMERFDDWEAVFIAKRPTQYVGYSYFVRDNQHTERLQQCMTGVRPEWRRQGIATALKIEALEYARRLGYQTIVTHNHRTNTAMLALNAKLGFCLVQKDLLIPDDLK